MAQVDQYNKLVSTDERVSDGSQLVHLKRFLKNIPDYQLMLLEIYNKTETILPCNKSK